MMAAASSWVNMVEGVVRGARHGLNVVSQYILALHATFHRQEYMGFRTAVT